MPDGKIAMHIKKTVYMNIICHILCEVEKKLLKLERFARASHSS
jgi:hypothetical protein